MESLQTGNMDWKHYNVVLLMLVFLVVCLLRTSNGKSYEGYKVIVLHPQDDAGLQVIKGMHENAAVWQVDFWSFPSGVGVNVTIAMPGAVYQQIKVVLENLGLSPIVQTEDLQQEVTEEKLKLLIKTKLGGGKFLLNTYHRHEEINQWLEGDVMNMCGDKCEIINIGKSTEGRDMKVIHIYDPWETKAKPAIWIDAGIHAREWIAPATAIYLINMLVRNIAVLRTPDLLVRQFDWYILPVANPDGYEYTFTDDRFWRKTRSNTKNANCPGADPNRNFGFHWMEGGASDNPCSDVYAGPEPFSEPETRAMRDFILEKKSELLAALTLHAYGQWWLLPWGYAETYPPDYQELKSAADAAAKAIYEKSNNHYTVGGAAALLYVAAGGSDDWMKGAAGIKHTACIELSAESQGFEAPAEQIEPIGEEIWEGIKAFMMNILEQQQSQKSESHRRYNGYP